MANFTKNISNSVRCFGNGPSTKWGQIGGITYTMVWGTTKWGENFAVITRSDWMVRVTSPVNPTFNYYGASVRHRIDNTLTIESEPASENLKSGNWSYVFVSDTTNGEDRNLTSWSAENASTVSYTCQTAGGTVWS